MVKRIIYPGTFDPITNGHLDILDRACRLFGMVEVVVGENPRKKALFPLQERYTLIRQSTANRKNVKVKIFKGLLVDYIRKNEKAIFIRGLRAVSDFEYELQMAMMNRKLNPKVETVFLMPNEKYIFLSSSLIQDIARNRGKIEQFVPVPVRKALKKKFK